MKLRTSALKILGIFLWIGIAASVWAGDETAAKQRVFFKNLKDGQVVASPVAVEMGVEGMTVGKAGEIKEGEGHHHIIVDGAAVTTGEAVTKDDTHIHFGAGQTEASVPLTPGKHTLTLQFADGAHRSFGPDLSSTVTVEVKG